ncbi:erythromycin esterase family protein [Streptomyces sp. BG9H]|uniref:Erythromycin esterase family protein n=1 Tax=Streptomyces anatolicus TaxID=2675858 RepID=A0ABS6YLA4_9ACTN|nr:erythromycin esterase family protein [Streptomyces anatolicus]MBW5422191.1 erythromycin esterase family protein [Streptomyces anatolicus]
MPRTAPRRVPLLLVTAAGTAALLAPAAAQAAPRPADPVAAIERAAHPLRSTDPGGGTKDLRPLGRMVGDASVVGLGEATHGSHEFFTMKERVFRYLVEEKGFTSFAQEVSWTTGLRFDAYVRGGGGDVRELVHRELAKTPWDTEEYVHLLRWMRAYNAEHPHRQVRFMGNDLNYPELGREVFDGVEEYVRAHEPDLLPEITSRYAPMRRLADGDAYMGRPLKERQELAEKAREALDLLRKRRPDGGDRKFTWALQHARSLSQTAAIYAFPLDTPEGQKDAMLYRDRLMAANTAWWQRHTGDKVLLSAHNAHVAYESHDPRYPKMQGAFLRDRLGKRYVSLGFTFDRGSFMAQGPDNGAWKSFTVGPATRGMNEHTLDKVRHDDYFVDMRSLPKPTRAWLSEARVTRSIGSGWPDGPYKIRLAPSHDILIHLHRVTAAHRSAAPAGSGD